MIPSHAPPEFADRSVLWNTVEEVEKSRKAQLAREINIALPAELPRKQQIELVREYCRDTFVSFGMCADFAIHDTGTGNPHAHIMLTMRPLKEDGTWDDKQRKVCRLDENGQKIYDPVKRQYDCDSVPTTDWNEHSKAEEWRAAWANLTNKYLEQNGIQVRVDHRSYKRQGIEQIPTIHLGTAATQMERRGIRTEKGDINRQIAADNKLLREIKARLGKLYHKTAPDKENVREIDLLELLEKASQTDAKSHKGKVAALQRYADTFDFIRHHNIRSPADLHNIVKSMNADYYALRSEIVQTENKIASCEERITMMKNYSDTKHIRKQLDSLKPKKRAVFTEEHRAELILFDAAVNYLDELKQSGEKIQPKKWQQEIDRLTAQKNDLYRKMHAMRDELKTAERVKKFTDEIIRHENTRTTTKDIAAI